MKPAIVGEAPSMRTSRPFAGSSGIRLAQLGGVTLDVLADAYRLTNLLGHWPGESASGKGSAFPMADARAAAARFRLWPGTLLCGRRVAQAFGLGRAEFFEPVRVTRSDREAGVVVFVIPHPSGVSRWWNEPSNVDAATAFMRRAIQEATEGVRDRWEELARA